MILKGSSEMLIQLCQMIFEDDYEDMEFYFKLTMKGLNTR